MFRRFLLAGFLTISCPLPHQSPVLLAQLHTEYSVLDWANLRLSRKVRRLGRNDALRERGVHLRFTGNVNPVSAGIRRSYGDHAWLIPRYSQLLTKASCAFPLSIQMIATELRDGDDRLLGGELGYTIGAVYTSLTGFLDRNAPAINHYGKLQLAMLAKILEQCGYAFWNLGEPSLQYKMDFGAIQTPRPIFLQRWRESITHQPNCALNRLIGQRLDCQRLLDGESR